MVPIGPKNNQATNSTGAQQRDRETNPKTPKFHVVLKGKIDAQWDTDDIIGTNDRKSDMSVLEWEFGGDLHKVKNRTGCLSALCAQNASHNGGQPIHELE